MTEVTQADPLERWPGYNEQSWPERFAELERRSRENITDLVDTLIVHRTAEAAKDARIAELEAAFGLALDILIAFEPGDSRAVSDQFVAMAAVLAGHVNGEAMDIIQKARAALRRAGDPQ